MTDTKLVTRDQIDPKYQWDLTSLFENDEAFNQAYEEAETEVDKLQGYKGRLSERGETLAEAFDDLFQVRRKVMNLIVYSHLKNDQDQTNAKYQTLDAKSQQLISKFAQVTSYIKPELMTIPVEELQEMIEGHERLGELEHYIDDLTRFRDYVLDENLELVLANATEIFANASKTFSLLTNADMEFPIIEDEDGAEVKLTHGLYGKYLESTDRRVRQETFERFYSVFAQFRNTLAQTLSTQIKTHNYEAKIRGFSSAREQALFNNNIPEAVYDALIAVVNDRIDLLHRYVNLRSQLLNISDLEMYDMYTPILGEAPIKFTYEEAKEVTLKALAPMGEEYQSILVKAFEEGWIDVYENKGKRSGAYSSGSYDSNPFILMNWQDSLKSLYTLVHELGHSVHSYLTHHHQPVEYGNYPIFLAEIASTTNENLLTQYLLETYPDKEVQKYILNSFLDGMKGTVFRQTQFAEFELFMHESDAKGQPLTADYLSENYEALNRKYYGDRVNSDSDIRYEWSRIPHFYYNFYVFQYSTGFAAATFFADKILAGDTEVLHKYMNFLKSGSSQYAIDTMKAAGLDMTQRDYLDTTLNVFEYRLNEFENLIKE